MKANETIIENAENHVQAEGENPLIALRKEKLLQLKQKGNAYPNDFKRTHLAGKLTEIYGAFTAESLLEQKISVRLAGRMMLQRIMGKASFIQVQDMSGRMQWYIREDAISSSQYEAFKTWDLGDLVGAEGYLFKTKTGELSVHVTQIRLLTKTIRPLPEKYHGLVDTELRYRMRYLDLIMNEHSRQIFQIRSQIITALRNFFAERLFMEVETPMMQQLAGGAAARPFITHHNTLDLPLYLRVAPELFLKRLVVGGFEKVFEINRNFRNEGISTQHNPEFTMLEFYEAYADYRDLMELTEKLFQYLMQQICGTLILTYQGIEIDFSKPFLKLSMCDAIAHFNPEIKKEMLDDFKQARVIAEKLTIPIDSSFELEKIQLEIFEKTVEHRLLQPTFITEYPIAVSPLSRRNDARPEISDRFELFIAGREIANGFSELNDPEDQAARFKEQIAHKQAGDEEAMSYDEDYIMALEYGLPPTAGEGIGIDRLVMLFTNSPSIRDVLLFPLMRQ